MTQRPGLFVAMVFALGALFGLATSSVLLGRDANSVRTAVEERAAEQPGPLADLLFTTLDEREVFDRVTDAVWARQIQNLRVATALTAAITIGLGVAFRRRHPDGADEERVPVSQARRSARSGTLP